MTTPEDRVEALVALLTLDEKASLTGGDDVWHLPAVERLGIGRLKVSDGPSGVRGERIGTRRSLSFPCGMAAGATWDVSLLERYGAVLAEEATAKGVHVLLGPTVCIPRTPLAGRTFESFAEDPLLSARLAVAYISGRPGPRGRLLREALRVQRPGARAHDHQRGGRRAALREIHLPSFEAAVRDAGAWSVMSAYNKVNGTYCGEHPQLLGDDLEGGVGLRRRRRVGLVRDAQHRRGLGGRPRRGDARPASVPRCGKLAAGVDAGDLDETVIDEQVRRILRLAGRSGLLDQPPADGEPQDPEDADRKRMAREVAVAGTVLLSNDGLLPLAPAVRRVAVIGPNSDLIESGGGGSSQVIPHRLLSSSMSSEIGWPARRRVRAGVRARARRPLDRRPPARRRPARRVLHEHLVGGDSAAQRHSVDRQLRRARRSRPGCAGQ